MSHTLKLIYVAALPLTLLPGLARAADKVVRLRVHPASIVLDGPQSRRQILVDGVLSNGDSIDLTHSSRFQFKTNESAARLEDGSVVRPIRDGAVRLFWAAEGGFETADPGFDPHLAPDPTPLWNVLDMSPAGRDADWYPKLEY